MIHLIVGRKGKGKTKYLLEKVNAAVKEATGNIVYIDKSTKHMYELCNKVRLINAGDFFINNSDEFIGFISGIISQDHDLEEMYFDSFLKVAKLEEQDILPVFNKLNKLSDKYNVHFIISVSLDEAELPEKVKPYIVKSL